MRTRLTVDDAMRLDALSDEVQRVIARHVEEQLVAAVDAHTRKLRQRVELLETRLAQATSENKEMHTALLRLSSSFSEHAQSLLATVVRARKRNTLQSASRQLNYVADAAREALPDHVAARIIEEQKPTRELVA